jgi:hypothetical protein
MSLKGKRVYTRKPSRGNLYKWTPDGSGSDKGGAKGRGGKRIVNEFCNALAFSVDGEDKITKYVVKKQVIDGQTKYIAYVSCDYVK